VVGLLPTQDEESLFNENGLQVFGEDRRREADELNFSFMRKVVPSQSTDVRKASVGE